MARANLIRRATVLIWDELPMANKAAVECVDNLCRALNRRDAPFGGIPFVGLGDFRQVAPVVKGTGVAPALLASIKSSHLWRAFTVLSLHQAIRTAGDPEYTRIVDSIGEDTFNRRIPANFVEEIDSVEDAIQFLFPPAVLANPLSCLRRAFLSPRNTFVDDFNSQMLQLLAGEESTPVPSRTAATLNILTAVCL